MKIATWNINGVKARIETLLTWLAEAKPDVACLQEIKSVDEGFPTEAIEAAGYNVAVHGQKGFNGVALLSRTRLEDVVRGLQTALHQAGNKRAGSGKGIDNMDVIAAKCLAKFALQYVIDAMDNKIDHFDRRINDT